MAISNIYGQHLLHACFVPIHNLNVNNFDECIFLKYYFITARNMFKESFNKTKVAAREAKARLGLEFYTWPQTYNVCYDVELKNLSSKSNKVEIIVPIPYQPRPFYDPKYQLVKHKEVESKANASAHLVEIEHRNEYRSFTFDLKPGEQERIGQKFVVATAPRGQELNKKSQVDWYDAKPWWPGGAHFCKSESIAPYDPVIAQLAKIIIGNEMKIANILCLLNQYLIDNLQYGNPINGLYKATDVLEKKKVDCGGYASLMVSLCRSVGIPARVVAGFWAGYERNGMHAWAEILYPHSEWIPFDPCIEQLFKQGRTNKFAKPGYIGSDRIVFSVGCDFEILTLDGNKIKVDILQNPIVISKQGEESVQLKTTLHTVRK
jgi:hypothetical protein